MSDTSIRLIINLLFYAASKTISLHLMEPSQKLLKMFYELKNDTLPVTDFSILQLLNELTMLAKPINLCLRLD